jgi:hypothetical protein
MVEGRDAVAALARFQADFYFIDNHNFK